MVLLASFGQHKDIFVNSFIEGYLRTHLSNIEAQIKRSLGQQKQYLFCKQQSGLKRKTELGIGLGIKVTTGLSIICVTFSFTVT